MINQQRKTKIKKGDEVVMLSGKDKGKRGKVLRIVGKEGKVIIEGINLVKKHQRPKRQGEKGEIIVLPRAVDISNVALYCASCGRKTRVGYRFSGEEKLRICQKCQRPL